MPDETRSNLEPINEGDLKLKEKFLGEAGKEAGGEASPGAEIKETPEKELSPERKEGVAEKDDSYSKILSKAPSSAPADDKTIGSDAEIIMREKDIQSKIDNLVMIADTKGVPHAVKVARHMEDNYTLDEFHDRLLSDELHDALVKRGMIKET